MLFTYHNLLFFIFPQYFLWTYPDDVDTVVVRAESKDSTLCAILSIQGTQVRHCYNLQLFYLNLINDLAHLKSYVAQLEHQTVVRKVMDSTPIGGQGYSL